MIPPQKWMKKRPGLVIPVFFLSLFPVWGQQLWHESTAASLGGTYVTRSGYFNARHNQAGLGWIVQHSFSLQHTRPFVIKELGISSLSAQIRTNRGALGTAISSFGINGLRHSSIWISYGLKLSSRISGGLGIHLWNSSIPEQILYQPGISCALGILAKVNESLAIGAHIRHPVSWSTSLTGNRRELMLISTGWSYTFFQTTTFYSEILVMPKNHIQVGHGIELKLNKQVIMMMGMQNRPFSISGGISLSFNHWSLHVAFEYLIDTGGSPSSSFNYAW